MVNIERITQQLSRRSRLESRLPRLSATQARAMSQAAQYFPITRVVNEKTWTLSLCLDNEPLTDDVWTFSISIIAGGGITVDIALSSLLVDTVTNGFTPLSDLRRMHFALRSAILAKALEPLLDMLESELEQSLELGGSSREPVAPSASDLLIRVQLGNDDVVGFARARVTDANADLVGQLVRHYGKANCNSLPMVRIPVTVDLPGMQLGAADLMSLRVGDVLRPGLLRKHRQHPFYIADNYAGSAWHSGQGQYLIKEITMTKTPGRPPDEQRFDDNSGLTVEADAVMVTLRFEIGQAQMNITDLLRLSVGQMLQIPDSGIGSIKVLANGALLGKGELVVIGNELGIRLVELSDGNQHRPD